MIDEYAEFEQGQQAPQSVNSAPPVADEYAEFQSESAPSETPDQGSGAYVLNPEAFAGQLKGHIDAGHDLSSIRKWIVDQGANPDTINGLEAAVAYRRKHKDYSTPVMVDPSKVVDSGAKIEKAQVNIDQGDGALGSFARGAADTATFGLLDEAGAVVDSIGLTGGRENLWNSDKSWSELYGLNRDTNRAILRGDEANHGTARFAGQVTGAFVPGTGIGGAAVRGGTGLARLGARGAIEGGVYGYGSSESSTLGGQALDTVQGAGLGALGDRVVAGAGRVLKPVVGEASRRLLSQGVELTPGQIGRNSGTVLGRGVDLVERGMAAIPGLKSRVGGAEERAMDSYRRSEVRSALTNERGEPILSSIQGESTRALPRSNAEAAPAIAAAERDLARARTRHAEMGRTPVLRNSQEYQIMAGQINEAQNRLDILKQARQYGGDKFRPADVIESATDRGLDANLARDAQGVLTQRVGGEGSGEGLIGAGLALGGLGLGYYTNGTQGALTGLAGAAPFTRTGQRVIANRMTQGLLGKSGREYIAPIVNGLGKPTSRLLGGTSADDEYDNPRPLGE